MQRYVEEIWLFFIGGSRGAVTVVAAPLSKIKESDKTKQKIEDNPLEK